MVASGRVRSRYVTDRNDLLPHVCVCAPPPSRYLDVGDSDAMGEVNGATGLRGDAKSLWQEVRKASQPARTIIVDLRAVRDLFDLGLHNYHPFDGQNN